LILTLEEINEMEDSRNIIICYIDDDFDGALETYLSSFTDTQTNVTYDEHKFLPGNESYESLLRNDQISRSDIIIIDSKLFENQNAPVNDVRLTGEKFKIAIKADFPYKKVFVISSKEIESDSVTISKFDSTRVVNPLEEAQTYYSEKLDRVLVFAIREIREQREIIPELSSIPDLDKVKVEKISNMEKGIKELDELSKGDIDTLVSLFQEIKNGYNK